MPYLGREPGVSNNVTGNLKVSGTISAESINDKLALNGSDASTPQAAVNDHFIFEDGGTDGSGTNAGDNLLLEDVTPSQAISGEVIGSGVPISSIAGSGTSGQVLQSQGSLLAPTFATITSAGLQHITTVTASDSASLDINSTFSSTYLNYLVVLTNLVPASNNVTMNMLFSANNGSSYITSNYQYVSKHFYVGPSGDGNSESTGTSPQPLATSCNNTAADAGTNGIISIYSPISDAMRTTYVWDFKSRMGDGSNYHQRIIGAGEVGGDLDTNAFQISYASGNVASGTVRVYGIIDS